jgi:hypothetical protein
MSSNVESKILLFLLSPEKKIFEFVSIPYCARTSSVGDVLDSIKVHTTEPTFSTQRFAGICSVGDDGNAWMDSEICVATITGIVESGQVYIAIPEQWTKDKCKRKVEKIMAKNPKLTKILQRPDPLVPRSQRKAGISSLRRNISHPKLRRNLSSTSLAKIAEEDEEDENESNATVKRGNTRANNDDHSHFDTLISTNVDSHVGTKVFVEGEHSCSLEDELEIKDLLFRKVKEEENVQKTFEDMIRRESAKRKVEKEVKQISEAKERARSDIERDIQEKVAKSIRGAEEKSKDLTAAERIEKLASEAWAVETTSDRQVLNPHSSATRTLEDSVSTSPAVKNESYSQFYSESNSESLSSQVDIMAARSRVKLRTTKRRLRRTRVAAQNVVLENKNAIAGLLLLVGASFVRSNISSAFLFKFGILLLFGTATAVFVLKRRRRQRRSAAIRRSISSSPRRRLVRGTPDMRTSLEKRRKSHGSGKSG